MKSEWVAAGAAVAAAVVGPLAALYMGAAQNRVAAAIARRQINATLVSGNRQAWIDKLRDAIAEYQAALRSLGFQGGHTYDRTADVDRRQSAMLLRARVALFINPTEPDHQQLMALMDKGLASAYTAGAAASQESEDTQAAITETAQRILKREWERVKAGEPQEGDD